MSNEVRKVTKSIRKEAWIKTISQCNASGLPIRKWCLENGVKESSYYYWLKKIRQEAIDQSKLKDQVAIVPMLEPAPNSVSSPTRIASVINDLPDSSFVTIKTPAMAAQFGPDAPIDVIINVLKVLKHA